MIFSSEDYSTQRMLHYSLLTDSQGDKLGDLLQYLTPILMDTVLMTADPYHSLHNPRGLQERLKRKTTTVELMMKTTISRLSQ